MDFILREAAYVLTFIIKAFIHILPYLAISVPAAVILKRTGISKGIEAKLKGKEWLAVVIATFVGAISPFCSCGVIPIIAALLTGGVPLAPVMSFWLASPSMDPEIFFLSVGTLGWELAVWRLAATFAMSLGAGFITMALVRKGLIRGNILRSSAASIATPAGPTCGCSASPATTARTAPGFTPVAACCAAADSRLTPLAAGRGAAAPACGCSAPTASAAVNSAPASFLGLSAERTAWLKGLGADVGDVLGRLVLFMGLAFLLEALIERYVPQNLIASLLGADSPLAVPFATLLGIPFYTTELSALGIVSGLLKQGMTPAAALAFLIGGGVTTLPAMAAVWGLVKPRIFGLYLAFCVAGSLLAGYALQLVTALR
jgi:uncharacterized membrane protein YraQ (UPF0718 family)